MEEKLISTKLLKIETKRRAIELNNILRDVEPLLQELQEIENPTNTTSKEVVVYKDPSKKKKAIELRNIARRLYHQKRNLIDIIKEQVEFIYEQKDKVPESIYYELKALNSQFNESKEYLFKLVKRGETELAEFTNKSSKEHYSNDVNREEKGNIRFRELQKMYQKYSDLWDDAKTQEEKDKIKETMLSILERIEKYETLESELRIKHFREKAKNYRLVLSVAFSGVILMIGVWLVLTGQSKFWDVGGLFIGYGLIGLGIDLNQIKKTFLKNQTYEN